MLKMLFCACRNRRRVSPIFKMNKKCPSCRLANFETAEICVRCQHDLTLIEPSFSPVADDDLGQKLDAGALWLFWRVATAVGVSFALLIFAYLSLLWSATPLNFEQQKQVDEAIQIIETRGLVNDAFWLRRAAYRSNDNWLNVTAGHGEAFAATNFPFEIITLYPEFFTRAADATERAAILLHEAQHLRGANEEQAYTFAWNNRYKLGWTPELYQATRIYKSVVASTKENAPKLFRCDWKPENDCTMP